MNPTQNTMTRYEVRADEVVLGDMRALGRNYISRVHQIEPYWTGPNPDGSGRPLRIDDRYLVFDGVIPPVRKDEKITVWR